MNLQRSIMAAAVAITFSAIASAEDTDWNQTTLTGSWHGTRQSLAERGVEIGLTLKSDLLANAAGGIKHGSALRMNAEAAASLDLEKLARWEGASAFVQYHAQYGNRAINDYTGSFAGVTNIETGANTGQFFQAWLQQAFADGKLALLAGLYAIDSEFNVTDTSGLFIQPPYGVSTDMAQTGRNGPPVFPMGALGLRLKYESDGYYAQAALTDGVPGDPDDPHGTHIDLGSGDGTLAIAEIGRASGAGKVGFGLWRYSRSAGDLSELDGGGNPVRRADRGAYVLAERRLLAEPGNEGQGLAGFARFGVVNKDAYQADWSLSLGLNYQGLIDGRDDDAAGIAVTMSHASEKYRQINGAEALETAVELTYRAQMRPWLALQPSLQYFRNPNMDPVADDAWVLALRVEMEF